VVPAEHGGNMDAPEASAGNTAYFPVSVRGALLFLGDGHAQMGDGEIAGTAIEVPMRARLKVDVIKARRSAGRGSRTATRSWRSAPTARSTTRCGSRSPS